MRRRTVLTGALLAAVAPSGADPHIAWLEEWRALRDRYNTLPDDGFDDFDGLWDRMMVLADRMYSTRPTSPDGVIAQLRFLQEDCAFFDFTVNPESTNNVISGVVDFLS